MKELTFEYQGDKFEPIGNILGGWLYKTKCTTWDQRYEKKFDYNDFYKTAKKNHASCDAYKINNSLDVYILTGAGYFLRLFNITNLKKCEEYSSWYHQNIKENIINN